MRFDDRLATVLVQPAVHAHGRTVQWRQLVELVARDGGQVSPELRDRALVRIARLMGEVSPDVLGATARAIASPQVPFELVALFAARGASAVAALLPVADLDAAGWAAVRAAAAPDVLPLLGEVAPVAASTTSAPPPVNPRPEPEPEPEASGPATEEPLPAGLFRWECGPTGEIDWVEGAPRAALIGRSLQEPFGDQFAARLPFSDAPLILAEEGELAGEWRWSGTPAFFPDTGRFAGYRGIARREGVERLLAETPALPANDDLRELMHELRTPLNAIIGFGEIIEGQYLGPAHLAYRARASEIVRQARQLADAVENLDLAAKLRSGRYDGESSAEMAVVREALADVSAQATARGVQLRIENRAGDGRVALPPLLTERLVRQLGISFSEAADGGETLGVVLDRLERQLTIGVERPRALRGLSEADLLGPGGVPGTRFALRLVQGLALLVGGGLDIAADRLVLRLPLLRE